MSLFYTKTGLNKGLIYRARYRCRNTIGWSSYSPITYLTAASVPTAPPVPVYVTATATTISITLQPSADNGGTKVTSYELAIDDGEQGDFVPVVSYDQSMAFVIRQSLET